MAEINTNLTQISAILIRFEAGIIKIGPIMITIAAIITTITSIWIKIALILLTTGTIPSKTVRILVRIAPAIIEIVLIFVKTVAIKVNETAISITTEVRISGTPLQGAPALTTVSRGGALRQRLPLATMCHPFGVIAPCDLEFRFTVTGVQE